MWCCVGSFTIVVLFVVWLIAVWISAVSSLTALSMSAAVSGCGTWGISSIRYCQYASQLVILLIFFWGVGRVSFTEKAMYTGLWSESSAF